MRPQDRYDAHPVRDTEVELFSVAGVDGFLREVNVSFARLLGVDIETLTDRSLLELVHPQDVPEVVAALAALESGASEVVLENRFAQQDGGWTHLQWVARPLTGTDLWWAAGRDTTPFHRLVAEGADLRARLELATGQAMTAMWELHLKSGTLTWEASVDAMLGLCGGDAPSTLQGLTDLARPEDRTPLNGAVEHLSASGALNAEFTMGETPPFRHLALRGKVLDRDRRGRGLRAVGLLLDLTNEKAMEQQVMRMVMTDALTGAPNRRAFDQQLRTQWRRCSGASQPVSIAILDIDDFKRFNDTFGHLVGDEVLTLVSRTLTSTLTDTAYTLARFGGEEFAVVLPEVDTTGALEIADRFLDAVRGVAVRQAPGWPVSISVGLATRQPHDATVKPSQLLSRADQALYLAKQEGKDQAIAYETALAERALLEEAIRSGIQAGEFEMHYQPVVALSHGRVSGFEALMRWNRPGHGRVAPDTFIPVAEKSDLIRELGRMALRLATTQLRTWIESGLGDTPGVAPRSTELDTATPLTVAVNLSGRHVADPLVVSDVSSALEASGLPASHLEVELTETALVDGAVIEARLALIRALGVSVSIDDFGTGYTSVGQLPHLPADVLKIDRSFVASHEPRQRELLALMISAAHAFGLRVIAEGVEQDQEMETLQGLECDQAQGYAIARPMSADLIPSWVTNWAWWPGDQLSAPRTN